jgi:hypothetical protein
MTDDLPWGEPTEPPVVVVERTPRRHRHTWTPPFYFLDGDEKRISIKCVYCGAIQDPARTKRGRSSLRAGKDAERAIAKSYGGRRTGHFGGPDDVVVGDLFIVQSKAGGWFSNRVWAELQKLPRSGGRIPTLVVSDRPGPGHKTRRYVIREMDDDIALHGEKP